ncbi:hypothetical protein FXO37_14786 [Capsicum annuum]|nr:hypothetical protein FXO37_14786 [Capsicum annuum]
MSVHPKAVSFIIDLPFHVKQCVISLKGCIPFETALRFCMAFQNNAPVQKNSASLRWIRGEIGLVSQELVLFGSTIKDNIAYGKNDATLEEIKDAVQLANASNFYAGAQLVESGKVTFAEAFRIFYGVSLTATVISQSGGLVPDSTEAKTGASSIVALFDRQSKIDSSNNSGMTLVLIQKVVQLYKRKCEGPVRAGIKEGLLSSARFGFSMFCWYYAYAVSFYAGARLIESGEVTFAEVLQVFYGLVFTVNTLYRSIDLVPDSTKAKTGASSIFALLDRKSKIDSSDNSRMTLDNLKENIEFQLSKSTLIKK